MICVRIDVSLKSAILPLRWSSWRGGSRWHYVAQITKRWGPGNMAGAPYSAVAYGLALLLRIESVWLRAQAVIRFGAYIATGKGSELHPRLQRVLNTAPAFSAYTSAGRQDRFKLADIRTNRVTLSTVNADF
jgi:hypothetical protein